MARIDGPGPCAAVKALPVRVGSGRALSRHMTPAETPEPGDAAPDATRPAPARFASHTELVHSGVRPGPEGAVVTPISVSTTFSMAAAGEPGEFDYARAQNPSRAALEEALATAEGARYAHAFSSGLAAIDALLREVPPGATVVVGNDAYGGTWRLLDQVWRRHGITTHVADLTSPTGLSALAELDAVAMVIVETPSNPNLAVADIAAVAAAGHDLGALVVVDNTFATPWLQRPLSLGADVSLHSATKYIGGHSDVVGGAVMVNDAALAERLAFTQKAVGAVPGPFDSFLMLRGLRTLGVRVDRQCANAAAVAAMLDAHPDVEQVCYPGLVAHPGHGVAAAQMRDFGAMVSFRVRGGATRAAAVCAATRLFTLAESLGAVESLIEHPFSMTHASNAGSPLEVDPSLVRISVGIEDVDDLVDDLAAALAATR